MSAVSEKILIQLRIIEEARIALYKGIGNHPELLPPRYDLFQYSGGFAWGYKGTGAQNLSYAMAARFCEDKNLDLVRETAEIILERIVSKLAANAEYDISYEEISKAFQDTSYVLNASSLVKIPGASEHKKPFRFHYKLHSNPDVAAITFSHATGFIALDEVQRIIKHGIYEEVDGDNIKPLSLYPSDENLFQADPDKIMLTFRVSGTLKMRMTRSECLEFLNDARSVLKLEAINKNRSTVD